MKVSWADLKIKTNNGKNDVMSTVRLQLRQNLRVTINGIAQNDPAWGSKAGKIWNLHFNTFSSWNEHDLQCSWMFYQFALY